MTCLSCLAWLQGLGGLSHLTALSYDASDPQHDLRHAPGSKHTKMDATMSRLGWRHKFPTELAEPSAGKLASLASQLGTTLRIRHEMLHGEEVSPTFKYTLVSMRVPRKFRKGRRAMQEGAVLVKVR